MFLGLVNANILSLLYPLFYFRVLSYLAMFLLYLALPFSLSLVRSFPADSERPQVL